MCFAPNFPEPYMLQQSSAYIGTCTCMIGVVWIYLTHGIPWPCSLTSPKHAKLKLLFEAGAARLVSGCTLPPRPWGFGLYSKTCRRLATISQRLLRSLKVTERNRTLDFCVVKVIYQCSGIFSYKTKQAETNRVFQNWRWDNCSLKVLDLVWFLLYVHHHHFFVTCKLRRT